MTPYAYLPILVTSVALISPVAISAAEGTPSPVTDSAENKAPSASISPEELAKTKNVPATLKSEEGDYTLVAVVEGVDSNRSLTQSIELIGKQRQRLSALNHQFDQTSTEYPQQRELLATKINEISKTLKNNLVFMSQKFAYSLNYNYVITPHISSLVSVTEVDGKLESKPVYQFKDAASYNDFQEKRGTLIKLAQQNTQSNTETAKPTDAMKKIQSELSKLYKFEQDGNYRLDIEKSAIYARPAQ